MTFSATLLAEAEALIGLCRSRGLMIATAESCTGGLVAGLITAVAGSSDVFDAGFVTYSTAAKAEMVGVPAAMIEAHGAVSAVVARAMAQGALAHSHAQVAVAITGIAGPGGGSASKPVGLVHLAAARQDGMVISQELRLGDIGREAVRLESVAKAIALLQRVAVTAP